MRRHVRPLCRAETSGTVAQIRSAGSYISTLLSDGGDGAFERTSSCEMLAVTDTALDLLVLQLLLQVSGLGLLLLRILAPVCAGSEYDVLADGGGI
jgi:hypothetical protein